MRNTQKLQARLVVETLNPGIRKAYRKLPQSITHRIEELVSCVSGELRISADQLVKYAFLVVAVERSLEGARVSNEHTDRARTELIGDQHGFELGYEQTAEARQRYRRGRQARQRIDASLQGLLKAWARVEEVIRRQRPDLPLYPMESVSDESLAGIRTTLIQMRRAVSLPYNAPNQGTSGRQDPTRSIHTYQMWLHLIPSYKGKWKEMHELALSWKLTETGSIEAFRHIVRKSCLGLETMHIPFGSAWIQLLSEKP